MAIDWDIVRRFRGRKRNQPHRVFAKLLGGIPGIEIIKKSGSRRVIRYESRIVLVYDVPHGSKDGVDPAAVETLVEFIDVTFVEGVKK